MSSELPQSWCRWVAENVILGVSDDQIFNEATAAEMEQRAGLDRDSKNRERPVYRSWPAVGAASGEDRIHAPGAR